MIQVVHGKKRFDVTASFDGKSWVASVVDDGVTFTATSFSLEVAVQLLWKSRKDRK